MKKSNKEMGHLVANLYLGIKEEKDISPREAHKLVQDVMMAMFKSGRDD